MMEKISSTKSFGGWHEQYRHYSETTNCQMQFAIYLPPAISDGEKLPVLYWLSGLTCTDENFMQKAGAQRLAAELGIVIVAPDTSPRGENVADDEGYDLGQGAGFYVNATQGPWAKHFQMYDYIVKELPELIESNFAVSSKKSISGHSMGGHGALTIGLKNADLYQSISAFSPICHPVNCPWGQKAFQAYFGDDQSLWQEHDATLLLASRETVLPMLIDQGLADNFYPEQLQTEAFADRVKDKGYQHVTIRMQEQYDHSYYFIASFIADHLRFHARYLLG